MKVSRNWLEKVVSRSTFRNQKLKEILTTLEKYASKLVKFEKITHSLREILMFKSHLVIKWV